MKARQVYPGFDSQTNLLEDFDEFDFDRYALHRNALEFGAYVVHELLPEPADCYETAHLPLNRWDDRKYR